MQAKIIDGKALAAAVKQEAAAQVEALKAQGVTPCLAVVLVGEDPASQVYVRGKINDCAQCGIESRSIRLPETTTQEELLAQVKALAEDSAVHGILVQLPLPEHICEKHIIDAIAPEKDVDGFTPVNVGKMVMEKASAHLTPVTLELGGKSPCIIDETANLKLAARRVAFGKYLNCGQTCVAPDYVLIDRKVKERFLEYLKKEIAQMYGESPLENPDYGKIINRKHFDRLLGLIDEKKLIFGGSRNEETLQIAPAVLDGVVPEDAVMQEEIFGPLLPVITVDSMNEALAFVNSRPKPLAFYIFTQDKETERMFLRRASFGGGCVNDTIIHLATSEMGFGGVGNSGMGSYHGKKSFDTFSHEKSIVKKYNWIDLPMRYQPYTKKKEKMIRTFLK